MIHSRHNAFRVKGARNAFTLIELLVVLGIIGLLAAILFPAFRRAQESGAQANCASNLKQIYTAVELYRQDEKYYPSSLAFLLPNDTTLNGGVNTGGTGFFKGGRDALTCNNDDTDASLIRSSYGNVRIAAAAPAGAEAAAYNMDMSNFLWNYWGYRADSGAACNDNDVSECAGTAYLNANVTKNAEGGAGWDANLLMNPTALFNSRLSTAFDNTRPENLLKYSLANRFAPTSTIITHCIYHRIPTAGGKISAPYEVTTDPVNGGLARDIVLRRDGSARVLDISKFHTNNSWSQQNF